MIQITGFANICCYDYYNKKEMKNTESIICDIPNREGRSRRPLRSFLGLDEALIQYILEFSGKVIDWVNTMLVSTSTYDMILQSSMWSHFPVNFCLVQNCYSCGGVKIQFQLAMRICKFSKMRACRIHTLTSQMMPIFSHITTAHYLRDLSLRFCNSLVATSKLNQLNRNDRDQVAACVLKDLTLIGIPPSCVSSLMQLQGAVTTLKLRSNFPPEIFTFILKCKYLEELELEGMNGGSFILDSSFRMEFLVRLIVKDVNIKIVGRLRCEQLRYLEYCGKSDLDFRCLDDITGMITCLPKSLEELKFPCQLHHVVECLSLVASRCSSLKALSITQRIQLDSSFQNLSVIQHSSITTLACGCPFMTSFELIGASIFNFSDDAFLEFGKFRNLQKLKIPVDPQPAKLLIGLLNGAKTIQEITFFGNSLVENSVDNASQTSWSSIEESLYIASQVFPLVYISLIDQWWS